MVLDTIPILGITRTDVLLYVVWLFMRLVVDVLICVMVLDTIFLASTALSLTENHSN